MDPTKNLSDPVIIITVEHTTNLWSSYDTHQAIADIGDRSGKEYQIEMQLAKMKSEWEPICFDCEEKYRTTDTYILKGKS